MRIDKNTKLAGQPAGPAGARLSSLVNRNVTIGRRRTSLRLEPVSVVRVFWTEGRLI